MEKRPQKGWEKEKEMLMLKKRRLAWEAAACRIERVCHKSLQKTWLALVHSSKKDEEQRQH
jgi:hypothetical protein